MFLFTVGDSSHRHRRDRGPRDRSGETLRNFKAVRAYSRQSAAEAENSSAGSNQSAAGGAMAAAGGGPAGASEGDKMAAMFAKKNKKKNKKFALQPSLAALASSSASTGPGPMSMAKPLST